MRFTFEGSQYSLGFERKVQFVTVMRHGKHHTVRSKYPYTTVVLYKRETPTNINRVVAHATVGCLASDPYSNKLGRLFAMRALNATLRRKQSKEFLCAMWKCYMERGKQQPRVVEAESVTRVASVVEVKQLALPPAQLTIAEQNGLDERVIH